MHLRGPIEALALDGSRVAYDVGLTRTTRDGRPVTKGNRVLVRNLHTGKTTRMSARFTAGHADCCGDTGGFQLAIAGSRVAWRFASLGNTSEDSYLLASALPKPKERLVTREGRVGAGCGAGAGNGLGVCAGEWLGGVVAAGDRILVSRWTTDDAGVVVDSGLYALHGARLLRIAGGTGRTRAVAADARRVALLRPDGTISLYSTAGTPLLVVTPALQAANIALSGRNLVVLDGSGALALYDARTGSLRKTFALRGKHVSTALAVQGTVAVYATAVRSGKHGRTTESAIRAIGLAGGRDRPLGRLGGPITLAAMNKSGLVYAGNGYGPASGQGTLAFLPFERIAAAVS